MPSRFDLRPLVVRLVGGVSRRTVGLEFDDLLALGCGVVREMDTRDPIIALTFDDGPSVHGTERILDVLDAYGARATFFMIGENAARHPRIARAVADRGHEIGCHGHRHLDFHWQTPWEIAFDLRTCKRTIEDVTGRPVHRVRAPFGHFRWDVRPIAHRLGLRQMVGWSIGPAWNEREPDRLAEYVSSRARPGAIVLLHDATGTAQVDVEGWTRTVCSALPRMISAVATQGLTCSALAPVSSNKQ
ncbi:MAG TPA: polysaccharide deacetylase family protein [Vicinamibacterales bacterium]